MTFNAGQLTTRTTRILAAASHFALPEAATEAAFHSRVHGSKGPFSPYFNTNMWRPKPQPNLEFGSKGLIMTLQAGPPEALLPSFRPSGQHVNMDPI